jgi:hypothetical protein
MNLTGMERIALSYLSHGWSVIPIRPRTKRPLIAWEPYQHRLPRVEEVQQWCRQWPNAGVGIVTKPSPAVAAGISTFHTLAGQCPAAWVGRPASICEPRAVWLSRAIDSPFGSAL